MWTLCAGTLGTSMARLHFPKHGRLVVFKKKLMCLVESLPSLAEVFARYFLSPESDWVENNGLIKWCMLSNMAFEFNLTERRVDSWAAPASLGPVQTNPVRVMHFIWNMYKNVASYK